MNSPVDNKKCARCNKRIKDSDLSSNDYYLSTGRIICGSCVWVYKQMDDYDASLRRMVEKMNQHEKNQGRS